MSFVSASARAHVSVVAKATTAKKSSATAVAAPKAKIASAIDRVKLPALALAAQATALVPAAQAEAGKLFDFDLTLPIIATEFLLLMTILDKTVFGPVGKAGTLSVAPGGTRDSSASISAAVPVGVMLGASRCRQV